MIVIAIVIPFILSLSIHLLLLLRPVHVPNFPPGACDLKVIVTGGWDRSLRVYDEIPREGDPPLLRQVSRLQNVVGRIYWSLIIRSVMGSCSHCFLMRTRGATHGLGEQ